MVHQSKVLIEFTRSFDCEQWSHVAIHYTVSNRRGIPNSSFPNRLLTLLIVLRLVLAAAAAVVVVDVVEAFVE